MFEIEIIILHSGRVNRLRECLNRVAPLTLQPKVTVKVSDNSGGNTSAPLVSEYGSIVFKHRGRCSFPEHFNINVKEAQADLVMLLHDDDAVKVSYIDAIREEFADLSVVAVSTNADVESIQSNHTKRFASFVENKTIKKVDQLLLAYFSDGGGGEFCPFSLYTYRRAALLQRPYRDDVAGKYSDVLFISGLLELGMIRWLCAPHGFVGHHGDNDSHGESSCDRVLQFNSIDHLSIDAGTLRLARRHIGKKIFLKLAADLYHFRKPTLRLSTYLSIAMRCM